MSETLNSLRQLHDGILAVLAVTFRDRVHSIAAYDQRPDPASAERKALVTPALWLELDSIGPGDDDGTDREPLLLTWVLHCVLSNRTAEVQLESWEFAAAVLAAVRHQRWGFPGAVGEPQALSSQPGEFFPDLAGFESRHVTWEQTVYMGRNTWAAAGTRPDTVLLSFAPDIGAAHEAAYVAIGGCHE